MNQTYTVSSNDLDRAFKIWDSERTQIESLITAVQVLLRDAPDEHHIGTVKSLCEIAAWMLSDTADFTCARVILETRT